MRPRPRRAGVALLVAASFAALIPATSSAAAFGARPLSTGSAGKDVRVLQRSLATLGYTAPSDGVYGKATKQAVKKLERKQGWRVDGRVTRKDALRIAKLVAKKKTKAQTMFYLGAPTAPAATVTVSRPGSLTLNVIDENNGLGTFSFPISFTAAGSQTVSWNGWTAAGIWAPDSVYRFRLDETGDTGATLTGQKAPFTMRRHAFPVPGAHSFGGAGSRFGAGRPGHVHQGQDMSASCGEPLVAAESGTVTTEAYQASGAGYYLIIQGKYTGTSHVYMHMQKPSWASEGTALYAGQQLGRVGTTGSSTGCHLHFERWSAPGWYEGGAAYDPLPELQYWDGYS